MNAGTVSASTPTPCSVPIPDPILGSMLKVSAGSFSMRPAMPPTRGSLTAMTARMKQPSIAMPNWNTSVIATPHRPEMSE